MTITQEIPDGLTWVPEARAYKVHNTGRYVDKLPPTQRYRYTAVKPFRIEQQLFKVGDEVGTGNVEKTYADVQLCDFEQAGDFKVSAGVDAGHIFPRLVHGLIRAEAIKD